MGCSESTNFVEIVDAEEAQLQKGETVKATDEEKKELDSLIHIEAMGKISEAVSSDQKIIWKLARAKKLFEKLDVDKSGHLSGVELNELADWVQHSLYPKGLFPDKVFSAADRASLLTEI